MPDKFYTFCCEECGQVFLVDEGILPNSIQIHTGYDDVDGELEPTWICGACAQIAEMDNYYLEMEREEAMKIKGHPIREWIRWYWIVCKNRVGRWWDLNCKTRWWDVRLMFAGGTCRVCGQKKKGSEMFSPTLCKDSNCLPF